MNGAKKDLVVTKAKTESRVIPRDWPPSVASPNMVTPAKAGLEGGERTITEK